MLHRQADQGDEHDYHNNSAEIQYSFSEAQSNEGNYGEPAEDEYCHGNQNPLSIHHPRRPWAEYVSEHGSGLDAAVGKNRDRVQPQVPCCQEPDEFVEAETAPFVETALQG